MSEQIKRYAALKTGSNIVVNIILASDGYALEGYTLQEVNVATFCDPGMFYNEVDGLYYQDAAFTTIYPVVEYESGSTDTEPDSQPQAGE